MVCIGIAILLRSAQWKADGVCVERIAPGRSPVNSRIPPAATLEAWGTASRARLCPLSLQGPTSFSVQPPLSSCSLVQVDSLSVTPGPLGVPELMVSQPGCAYAILLCTWNKDTGPPATSEGAMEGSR